MNRAEAEAILEVLDRKTGEPDSRPWGAQYVELSKLHRAGAPTDQAERLQRLYRRLSPSLAESRMVAALEDQLLPALAKATETTQGVLRARLHRDQPAFPYTAPERPESQLPPVPERAGWDAHCAFRIFGGAVAIGESFDLEVHAENGIWFAYQREDESGCGVGLAIHETVRALPNGVGVGTVGVEGGTVPVLDLEVRDDVTFQREMELARDILRRGYVFGMGGDGDTLIRAARRSELAVCLWIGGE
jgi:hypothetical protein